MVSYLVYATLRDPTDWEGWIANIHRVALIYHIWQYMDPSLKEQPEEPDPDKIEEPHPSQIREGAETPGDLTDGEYRTFQWKVAKYDRDYERARRARYYLAEMMIQIDRTVDSSWRYLINNCLTPWSMLSRLQGPLKPRGAGWKEDIGRRYY